MKKINNLITLEAEIALLEIQLQRDELALKNQAKEAYESLKPIKMLKNTLSELTSMPEIKSNLTSTAISLLAGFAFKKVLPSITPSPIKMVLTTMLQMGLAKYLARRSAENHADPHH